MTYYVRVVLQCNGSSPPRSLLSPVPQSSNNTKLVDCKYSVPIQYFIFAVWKNASIGIFLPDFLLPYTYFLLVTGAKCVKFPCFLQGDGIAPPLCIVASSMARGCHGYVAQDTHGPISPVVKATEATPVLQLPISRAPRKALRENRCDKHSSFLLASAQKLSQNREALH